MIIAEDRKGDKERGTTPFPEKSRAVCHCNPTPETQPVRSPIKVPPLTSDSPDRLLTFYEAARQRESGDNLEALTLTSQGQSQTKPQPPLNRIMSPEPMDSGHATPHSEVVRAKESRYMALDHPPPSSHQLRGETARLPGSTVSPSSRGDVWKDAAAAPAPAPTAPTAGLRWGAGALGLSQPGFGPSVSG
ncbi:unnamed protein product [Pleuronectes platessa]|uniref:Uncharacterized protein n=1 Tax=Pleuronectes platessa TaxID=8262 RepID=A0A9N7UAV0_PLEPL|nr:unnamed protein product [Pleuronectes platessa]